MTLAAVCAWCFLRASAIALVAVVVSRKLAVTVGWDKAGFAAVGPLSAKSNGGPDFGELSRVALGGAGWSHPARAAFWRLRSPLIWTLLLAPFLVPHLLVGYAYSRLALWLIHDPFWNEVAYGLLLLLKFFPAAVVIRVFAPPSPVSAEAIFCQRLLRRPGEGWLLQARQELGSWVWGAGRASIAAFVVVFLLVFQEFEIASLMGITAVDAHSPVSWTVWIFDAHAGGVPLAVSLEYALTPLAFELAVVLPALALLPSWMSPGLHPRNQAARGPGLDAMSGFVLVSAAILLAGAPSVIVLRGAAGGIESLSTSLPALREIAIGAATAFGAALLTCGLALLLIKCAARRTGRGILTAALSLPGLLGSLVLSLAILGLFQLPGFRALSQSLVPLILALVLFILPRAWILFAVTGIARRTQSAHCAWMLVDSPSAPQRRAGARLVDELEIKAIFWCAVLVWYWAYWELTPASLLAPPAAMSFSVRLYNFMHYGQSNALSTMLLAAVAFPIATVVVLARLRPALVRLVLR